MLTLPDTEGDLVSASSVLTLGLFWCQGNTENKADLLFELINPPTQSQVKIAFNDKDMDPALQLLMTIASHTIIEFIYRGDPEQLTKL